MANIASVEAEIAQGMEWVLAAERAYRAFEARACSLRTAAEHTYYIVLGTICQLTMEEADRIEPAFSQFEECLERLQGGTYGSEGPFIGGCCTKSHT